MKHRIILQRFDPELCSPFQPILNDTQNLVFIGRIQELIFHQNN
jgi:hypothetical protein